MELDKLRAALYEAESGLGEVEQQYKELALHRDKLLNVVNSLREVLPREVREDENLVVMLGRGEEKRPSTSNPTWSKAKFALEELGRPATVPEIAQFLARKMSDVPSQDAVRVAMLRRTDLFTRAGKNSYGLVGRDSEDAQEELLPAEEATEVAS